MTKHTNKKQVRRDWIAIDREQHHRMWSLVCSKFTVVCWSSYVGSGIKHDGHRAYVGYTKKIGHMLDIWTHFNIGFTALGGVFKTFSDLDLRVSFDGE